MEAAFLVIALQLVPPPTPAPGPGFHPAEEPGPRDAEVRAWIDSDGERAWDRVHSLALSSDPFEQAAGSRGLVALAERALAAGDCSTAAELSLNTYLAPVPHSVRLDALRTYAAAGPPRDVARRLELIRAGRQDAGFAGSLPELADLADGARCPAVDLELLLARVRALQERDLDRWRGFTFERKVIRERFENDGDLKRRELLHFLIRPRAGGFDEQLVSVDGDPPSRSEVVEHRKAGRFEKHWRSLRRGEEGDEAQEGFSLRALLEMPAYEDRGIVRVGGVECRRLDFRPAPAGGGEDLADRLADAMEGSLFVSLRGSRVVRAEARTVRPVRAYGGLAGVRELEVEMEQGAVEPDLWLPSRIEVRSVVRVLLGTQRKRNVYSYWSFAPAATSQ